MFINGDKGYNNGGDDGEKWVMFFGEVFLGFDL